MVSYIRQDYLWHGAYHYNRLMTLDAVITGNTQALRDALRHLALPATTLGAGVAAVVARVTRSSMLEALKTDYVLFAKAKGGA